MHTVVGGFTVAARVATGTFPLDPLTVDKTLALDGVYPDYSMPHYSVASGYSDAVKVTGWSGSIPVGVTITGVEVTIYRVAVSGGGTVGTVTDGSVMLVKAGSAVGANRASADVYPSVVTAQVYGSSSDMWGTTWASTDFDSTFGVQFSSLNPTWQWPLPAPNNNTMGYWDYVKAAVSYTTTSPGGGGSTGTTRLYHLDGGSDYNNGASQGHKESILGPLGGPAGMAFPLTNDLVTWETD